MSKSPSCANCKFFSLNDVGEPEGGQCRYSPPVPMLLPQAPTLVRAGGIGVAGIFPPVSPDTYCFKHEPAPATLSGVH